MVIQPSAIQDGHGKNKMAQAYDWDMNLWDDIAIFGKALLGH